MKERTQRSPNVSCPEPNHPAQISHACPPGLPCYGADAAVRAINWCPGRYRYGFLLCSQPRFTLSYIIDKSRSKGDFREGGGVPSPPPLDFEAKNFPNLFNRMFIVYFLCSLLITSLYPPVLILISCFTNYVPSSLILFLIPSSFILFLFLLPFLMLCPQTSLVHLVHVLNSLFILLVPSWLNVPVIVLILQFFCSSFDISNLVFPLLFLTHQKFVLLFLFL